MEKKNREIRERRSEAETTKKTPHRSKYHQSTKRGGQQSTSGVGAVHSLKDLVQALPESKASTEHGGKKGKNRETGRHRATSSKYEERSGKHQAGFCSGKIKSAGRKGRSLFTPAGCQREEPSQRR